MYAVDVRFSGLHHRPGQAWNLAADLDPSWLATLRAPSPLADDGDFAIDGRSVREADEPRRSRVGRAIKQRHQASIWLVGNYRVYATTPADT
jgi:hypothetical protein